MARILDACCGSRMCWFDKNYPDAIYMDNREIDTKLCDGRQLLVKPDIVADFRNMPFQDDTFYLVLFDPPHLQKAGKDSWLAQKYGLLSGNWQEDIKQGFVECMRVLKPNGVLIFKWCEEQITTAEILRLLDVRPLFGHRRGKTIFIVFMK